MSVVLWLSIQAAITQFFSQWTSDSLHAFNSLTIVHMHWLCLGRSGSVKDPGRTKDPHHTHAVGSFPDERSEFIPQGGAPSRTGSFFFLPHSAPAFLQFPVSDLLFLIPPPASLARVEPTSPGSNALQLLSEPKARQNFARFETFSKKYR
jgi:hypothetical protein